MIDKGIITEFNYTEHLNISEYTKYRKFIEDAFRYKRESQYTGSRNLDVIYISGDSDVVRPAMLNGSARKKDTLFSSLAAAKIFWTVTEVRSALSLTIYAVVR